MINSILIENKFNLKFQSSSGKCVNKKLHRNPILIYIWKSRKFWIENVAQKKYQTNSVLKR